MPIILMPISARSQSVEDLDIYVSGGVTAPFSSNSVSNYYKVDTSVSRISLPTMSFSGKWTPSFNFGFGLGYAITPSLSVIMDLNYNSFNLDKSSMLRSLGYSGNEYMDDATLKMVSINANAKYVLLQPELFFDPYVIVGVGYTSVAASGLTALFSAYTGLAATFNTQDALNTSLGVGIDIRGGQSSSVFIDVRYDVACTQSASPFNSDNFAFVPIRIGFKGTF